MIPTSIAYLQEQCRDLPPQKSEAWLKYREGKLTGSDMAAALKISTFKTYVELLAEKCGHPSIFKGNKYTQWGEKYEDEAVSVYENETGEKVHTFSILPHPFDPRYAFSPDGITENNILIEVKCPYCRQIKHEIPSYYFPQIQLGLQILKEHGIDTYAHFVQYRPFTEPDPVTHKSYHMDILRVDRDDVWWKNIHFKIFSFWKDVEKYQRIGIDRHPLYKDKSKIKPIRYFGNKDNNDTDEHTQKSTVEFRDDNSDID